VLLQDLDEALFAKLVECGISGFGPGPGAFRRATLSWMLLVSDGEGLRFVHGR